jgi:hypothetical protein
VLRLAFFFGLFQAELHATSVSGKSIHISSKGTLMINEDAPVQNARGKFGKSGPYRGTFSEGIRGISWLFLKAAGWHVATDWPDVPKSVVIAAPHTSNFDGLLMLAIAGWYRQKLSWMGKASLVSGPFGGLVRRAGCVPVDRSKSGDVVTLMRENLRAGRLPPPCHFTGRHAGCECQLENRLLAYREIGRCADADRGLGLRDKGNAVRRADNAGRRHRRRHGRDRRVLSRC